MNLDYIAVIISILSAVIAVVAIVRAREANRIATDANKIITHYNLRPMRLDSCNLLKEFAHYCTTYRTKFLQKMVVVLPNSWTIETTLKKDLKHSGLWEWQKWRLKLNNS